MHNNICVKGIAKKVGFRHTKYRRASCFLSGRCSMRYLVRQKISLQLLSLYLLFVIPVLLGSVGLYLFQQNVLTQNAFQSDLGLAQAVALEVGTNLRAATEIDTELSTAQAARDLDLKQLASIFANSAPPPPDITLYY